MPRSVPSIAPALSFAHMPSGVSAHDTHAWGDLFAAARSIDPSVPLWAGLAHDAVTRAAQVRRYLDAGGSPNAWVVAPRTAHRDAHPPPIAPDHTPIWRAATTVDRRAVHYQALPLVQGLLWWALWDEAQRDLFADRDPAVRAAQDEAIRLARTAGALWWPAAARNALAQTPLGAVAAHPPAPDHPLWWSARSVPEALWNTRVGLHTTDPTRFSAPTDYIESPLVHEWTRCLHEARGAALCAQHHWSPEHLEKKSKGMFLQHLHVWLVCGATDVVADWTAAVDALAAPASDGARPAVPQAVPILEARDLLRAAIRLSARAPRSEPVPVAPWSRAFVRKGAAPPGGDLPPPPMTVMGRPAGCSPGDWLLADVIRRLGPAAVRTLPLASGRTIVDEWIAVADTEAVTALIAVGWTPTHEQMHAALRALMTTEMHDDAHSAPWRRARETTTALLAAAWWRTIPLGLPLPENAGDALGLSASLGGLGRRRAPDATDPQPERDVLRVHAPATRLLRPLRQWQSTYAHDAPSHRGPAEIVWMHHRDCLGAARRLVPWMTARDARVVLAQTLTVPPPPTHPIVPHPPATEQIAATAIVAPRPRRM